MTAKTKTQLAIDALINHEGGIKNRGHAFKVLSDAGLTGSGQVYNKAVRAYEFQTGEKLMHRRKRQRAIDEEKYRAQAHQMSADEVIAHVNDIDEADELFWACWKVFRYEGKWQKALKADDFAVHFSTYTGGR